MLGTTGGVQRAMVRKIRRACLGLLWAGTAWGLGAACWAQAPAAGAAKPRQLAEGVLKIVPALVEPADTVDGPVALPDLAAKAANLDWKPATVPAAKTLKGRLDQAFVRRPVWQLEFGYKPLRMLRVSVPRPDGTTESKVVWYLVYYVRNAGTNQRPVPAEGDAGGEQLYTLQPSQRSIRFLPTFTLVGHDRPGTYAERILPGAVAQIRQRELPNEPLYDSIEISRRSLTYSDNAEAGRVWGVATWTDIDPQTDYMSVLVEGLTNGYQLSGEGEQQEPRQRTLEAFFWRPGDDAALEADRIRFGVPLVEGAAEQAAVLKAYGTEERLDYRWVYR